MKNVLTLTLLMGSLLLLGGCASMQDKPQCNDTSKQVSHLNQHPEAYCAQHPHFEDLRI